MAKKVSNQKIINIWESEDKFKLFISHLDSHKIEANNLKNDLSVFGVTSFVAHDDIKGGVHWQNEIKNALLSMQGFVALIHPGFHNSPYTDQEIGFALCRNVPIISVNRGEVPKGFINVNQALKGNDEEIILKIIEILLNYDNMLNAYLLSIKNCPNYDRANILAKALPFIQKLSEPQLDILISAFNNNRQINESVDFWGGESRVGGKKYDNGKGLVFYLNRITKRNFEISDKRLIIEA